MKRGALLGAVLLAVLGAPPAVAPASADDAPAGGCTTPPAFAGLTSAAGGGYPFCSIVLNWAPATPTCPNTTVSYSIYRSLTPGFTPGPSNLRKRCVASVTYVDRVDFVGTRYHYVVRAEDSQGNGSGPCNGGNEDANLQERSALGGGPVTTVNDDLESGGSAWDTTGGTGGNPWTVVTTASHSPTHAWFWPNAAVVTLQPLTRIASFAIGPGGGRLSWWHRVQTESTFDGYVLEYSLDNGVTWTDILLGQGPVPGNQNRFLQNGYNATLSTGFQNPLPGRRAWSGTLGNPGFAEVVVDLDDFKNRAVKIRWRAGSDSSVSAPGIWIDDIALSSFGSCTPGPDPCAGPIPFALAVDPTGNGVYQPNETVIMAPSWRYFGCAPVNLTGTLLNHLGAPGPTYSVVDGFAAYGTVPVGATASCTSQNDCYSVRTVAATRPAMHWDTTALEMLSNGATTKDWTLHIGGSFIDVPGGPFFRFVETLLHRGVTGGCTPTAYCPSTPATRGQMAVFLLLTKEGPGYTPPACGTAMFSDVPATSPLCRWVEELVRRGAASGCGGGRYCPDSPVSREQMPVFVLRVLDPTLNPPPCGAPLYADVPASSPFCRWIEELSRRGVVAGCGGGNYCPTAAVTRAQMSVFLTVTFGLTLYGL